MEALNKELSSPKTPAGSTKNRTSGASTPRALEVRSLKDLDEKTLRILLTKKKSLETEITRGFAEQAIPLGIYKDEEHTYWVCPKSLFSEDNIIGQMIADFSILAKASIKEIPSNGNINPNTFDKKFIAGIWFGIYSTTALQRRRAKKGYELGRTATFALIVKNEFARIKKLGVNALAKDNFYFGNNPMEVSNKVAVPFYMKTALRSYFDDPRVGDLIFGIVNYTASQIGFDNLTEDAVDKAINDNLMPADHLITSCYPSIVIRQNRRVERKQRKPNSIRSSPLYTAEEMELIKSYTSVIYDDMSDLQGPRYVNAIFSDGFDAIASQVRRIIQTRSETLQRFANRTKIRLQMIRKITGEHTLRKAKVTRDHLNRLLADMVDPVSSLVNDISHIVGESRLTSAVAYFEKRKISNYILAREYLYNRSLGVYQKIAPKNPKISSLKAVTFQEPEEMSFVKALEAYHKVRNYVGGLTALSQNLPRLKTFKIFGRVKSLKSQMTGLKSTLTTLKSLDTVSADTAILLGTNGKYDNRYEYVQNVNETVNNIVYLQRNALSGWQKNETSGDVKSALEDLSKFLNVFGTAEHAGASKKKS